jgi:hypothetical protein
MIVSLQFDEKTPPNKSLLAVEYGATFYTNDRDFRIFPQLDVRFPLRNDD